MAYSTVPVTGTYVALDGTAARGSVSFTGKVLTIAGVEDILIAPYRVTTQLDATGSFSISLPATDDPNVLPNGWTYSVVESLDHGGGRRFELDVPLALAGTGIDLSTVAPTTAEHGDPTAFVTLTEFDDLEAELVALAVPGPQGAQGETGPQGPQGETGPAVADTGWRDIASLVGSDYEIAGITPLLHVRRVGHLVTIRARVRTSATGTGTQGTAKRLVTLPVGFIPAAYGNLGPVSIDTYTGAGVITNFASIAQIAFHDPGSAVARVANVTTWFALFNFVTDNDWPLTLPGTAV